MKVVNLMIPCGYGKEVPMLLSMQHRVCGGLEQGLLHVANEKTSMVRAHAGSPGCTFDL